MILINQREFKAKAISPECLSHVGDIYIRPEDVRVITRDDEYVDILLKDGMLIEFKFEEDGYPENLIALFFYNDEFRKPVF